jgi:hypothetical protein
MDANGGNAHPPLLSFVIPALNEEVHLPQLLASIRQFCPCSIPYEVVVVDNGSFDRTVEIARTWGARVIDESGSSLGSMRNEGARRARGQVVVFLDADVRLTASWARFVGDRLARVLSNPKAVSGSRCEGPDGSNWIARAWTDLPSRTSNTSHIGTGHMIVERRAFLDVGGFDQNLPSGEDYEFCRRAQRIGYLLEPDSRLKVVHARPPQSLGQFVRRELWHGSGDSLSVTHVIRSPVALAAISFAGVHALAVVIAIAPVPFRGLLVLGCACLIAGVCIAASIRRGGSHDLRMVLLRSALMYVYLWARFLSLFIGGRQGGRWHGWKNRD